MDKWLHIKMVMAVVLHTGYILKYDFGSGVDWCVLGYNFLCGGGGEGICMSPFTPKSKKSCWKNMFRFVS